MKFKALTNEIDETKSLSNKVKELVKLSACTTQGSMFGVSIHVRQALKAGASEDEIIDTIICCLPVCGISYTNQALESAKGTLLTIQRTERNN